MGRGARGIAATPVLSTATKVDPAIERVLQACRLFARLEEDLGRAQQDRNAHTNMRVTRASRPLADRDRDRHADEGQRLQAVYDRARQQTDAQDLRVCALFGALDTKQREVASLLAQAQLRGLAYELWRNVCAWVEGLERRAALRATAPLNRVEMGVRLDAYLLSESAKRDLRDFRDFVIWRGSPEKTLRVKMWSTYAGVGSVKPWHDVYNANRGYPTTVRELAQQYRKGLTFSGQLTYFETGATVLFPRGTHAASEDPLAALFATFTVSAPKGARSSTR